MPAQTTAAAIADYLETVATDVTEDEYKATILEAITTRWPDASAIEIEAAYAIAMLRTTEAMLDTALLRAAEAGRSTDGGYCRQAASA